MRHCKCSIWPRIVTTCCMRFTVVLLVDCERSKRPVAVPRRRATSLKWLCSVHRCALHMVCVWAVSNHEIARDLTWNRLLLSNLVCLRYILSVWTQQEARRACLVHFVRGGQCPMSHIGLFCRFWYLLNNTVTTGPLSGVPMRPSTPHVYLLPMCNVCDHPNKAALPYGASTSGFRPRCPVAPP